MTNRKNFRVVLDGKIFVEDSRAQIVKTLYFECWDCSSMVSVICDPRMNFVFNKVQCARCWKNLNQVLLMPSANTNVFQSNGGETWTEIRNARICYCRKDMPGKCPACEHNAPPTEI